MTFRPDPKPTPKPKKARTRLKRTPIKNKSVKVEHSDGSIHFLREIILKTVKNSKPSKLEGLLDHKFSIYVRKKNADPHTGFLRCFTCRKGGHWKSMQNGHFMPRKHMATRWHLINCQPQCDICNMKKGGNLDVFALNLDKKYGQGTAKAMEVLSKMMVKYTQAELKEMIEKFKQLISEL